MTEHHPLFQVHTAPPSAPTASTLDAITRPDNIPGLVHKIIEANASPVDTPTLLSHFSHLEPALALCDVTLLSASAKKPNAAILTRTALGTSWHAQSDSLSLRL